MQKKYKNLNYLLEYLLKEEASDIGTAVSNELALMLHSISAYSTKYILYSTKEFKKIVTTADLVEIVNRRGRVSKTKNPVYGYIKTEKLSKYDGMSYGANMVALSVAKDRYGPMMYDIAMSENPNGIVSDRDSVSNTAKKVWKYYFNSRSDVEKKPLDDISNPKTPTKIDDSLLMKPETLKNPLNWAYSVKSPLNTSQLETKHEETMLECEKILMQRFKQDETWPDVDDSNQRRHLENYLIDSAGDFFDQKYNP